MKCMIAFACLLAVASAGYINNAVVYGAYDDGSYKGEFYNGNLRSFYGGALGYAGYGNAALAYSGYASPLAYSGYAAPLATQARLVDPVAIAAGAPLPTGDTVEVAAAKASHFQAHAAAKGLAYSAYSPALAYSGYGYAAAPIARAYGYAHAAPLALASEARLVDPVAIAAGAPLPTGDTVEVAAAKAAHFQAHAAVKAGHSIAKRSPGLLNTGYAAPLAYSAPISSYGYSTYAAPVRSFGYSSVASPLAYSGYTGYTGYGYGATPYFG